MIGMLAIPPAGARRGYGFVRPVAAGRGGSGDVFVPRTAVKHVGGTDVEIAEWPGLAGKWIAVDRTRRRRDGRREAAAARIVERPAQDLAPARAPRLVPAAGGAAARNAGGRLSRRADCRWPALIGCIEAAARLAADLKAGNARVKLLDALREAQGAERRADRRRTA